MGRDTPTGRGVKLNASRLRLILGAPLLLFAPWLGIVLLVTWAGYPGVVCVTPVAWLLALRVGLVCAGQSASPWPAQRLQEAALAGGFFGLLQGALFWISVPRLGEIKASEEASAKLLTLGMIGVGMLAGAGLAVFTAALVERRREAR